MAAKEESKVESVKMTDGRVVEFPGKRKLDKSHQIGTDGKVSILLDFRNGETRTFVIPDMLTLKFAAHGAEQKLGDEIAGVDEIDDCVEGIDELIMRLQAGEWTAKREASALAGTSILLKAIVEVKKKPVEKIRDWLKSKTPVEKLALRESAEFASVVKRLEAERDAKRQKVDATPLLGEIDAIPA